MSEKNMEAKTNLDFLEDSAFADQFVACENVEAVQALFKTHGVELTLEEVEGMGRFIKEEAAKQYSEGELSDEDMEQVAGGVAGWLCKTVGKKLGQLILVDGYKNVVKPCVKMIIENPKKLIPFYEELEKKVNQTIRIEA